MKSEEKPGCEFQMRCSKKKNPAQIRTFIYLLKDTRRNQEDADLTSLDVDAIYITCTLIRSTISTDISEENRFK